MHSKLHKILIASALCVAVSSCGSRVETLRTFPPAADLQPDKEPEYPIEALSPGEAGAAAEKAWWNSVLLWGRNHHDKVARVCKWAVDLGYKLPAGYCDN